MKKFRVIVPYAAFVSVEVEANSKEEAEEIGIDESCISGYCGNGGVDKLIGVSGENCSIEAGEILDIAPFSIEAEEIAEV